MITDRCPFFDGVAETVYFGGGTPSLHPPDEIEAILATVRGAWGVAVDAEITLEANPGTIEPATLAAYRAAGVNRISIGAQSFSQRKLDLLFRDHNVAEVHDALNAAHQADFENDSLDLIFGLPGETLEEWKADLEWAVEAGPAHVSLYNLEYHEGTPFARWREAGRFVSLNEDLEADMYLLAHEVLTRAGFNHYEVSNFARPGFQSVHNSCYWKSKPYLGLGPGAHSFDGQRTRFHNVGDVVRYLESIAAGQLPVENRVELSDAELAEEWMSLSLRRREGIRWDDAVSRLGAGGADAFWERARALPATLRDLSDSHLRLTPEGWFRENSVLLWLMAVLPESHC